MKDGDVMPDTHPSEMRCLTRVESASWDGVGRSDVWIYPTFPPPLRVSYLIQIPKAIRLKVSRCWALPSPPPPKRPRGIRAYKAPARPRWGLCFCLSGWPSLRP